MSESNTKLTARIALDAMGGDYAPAEPVKGAVEALSADERIFVYLVGAEDELKKELANYTYPKDRLAIVHAPEVIETAESPARAIQAKRNSSLVQGLQMVHEGRADAFVSSGSTGAVLVGGQAIVKKIRGIQRAPLAPLIPTEKGISLLIDCGATVDARPAHLVQFAVIGSIYMKHVMGLEKPRVALVNIGAEEEKGNALAKETYPLLAACPDIHFVGNIEARDIPKGEADVIVTEAFVGNVILKLYEGVGSVFINKLKTGLKSSVRAKLGAALALPAIKTTLKDFDVSNYGGAPLLGLQGLVVKTHGSSKAVEIRNTLLQCLTFQEQDINGKIREYLEQRD